MTADEIFSHISVLDKIHWNPHLQIQSITSDSRAIAQGDVFVACQGTRMDGHDFIGQAIMAGAGLIVCDRIPEMNIPKTTAVVRVRDSRDCLAQLLKRFYDSPDKKMKLIGVTGTNGKTTTSYLLYNLLRQKAKSAYIGTLEYQLPSQKLKALNTTPGPEILIPLLAQMYEDGVEYCVLEVSSHALEQRRVHGLQFELAIFTQLTQDHLDYHLTMERYYQSKRGLFFELPQPRQSLINRDCAYGRRLLDENLNAKSFSLSQRADYTATKITGSFEGSRFDFSTQKEKFSVKTTLPFNHNVSNSLAVLGALDMLGFDTKDFQEDLDTFEGIPGRLERVAKSEDFDVFVDYAHTPDAFESVLGEAFRLKTGRVLTLFGCGGDRDLEKRAMMTRVACQYSDVVVLTTDNPRSEDPEMILNDMKGGISEDQKKKTKIFEILDRKEAIEQLIASAEPGDVVFVLGKGHEDYQILGDKKIPFDDRLIVQDCLKRKSNVFLS